MTVIAPEIILTRRSTPVFGQFQYPQVNYQAEECRAGCRRAIQVADAVGLPEHRADHVGGNDDQSEHCGYGSLQIPDIEYLHKAARGEHPDDENGRCNLFSCIAVTGLESCVSYISPAAARQNGRSCRSAAVPCPRLPGRTGRQAPGGDPPVVGQSISWV